MSEFKIGDEVWMKGKVAAIDEEDDSLRIRIEQFSGQGRLWVRSDQLRKLEPDEITRAKERVIEAAKEWGKVVAAVAPYDCPLIRAVNALEALEKPSLEDDLRIELEDLVFKVTDASSEEDEGVAPAVRRILAIIEKHKGEE